MGNENNSTQTSEVSSTPVIEPSFVCSECETSFIIANETQHTADNRIMCSDCFYDNYSYCEDCNRVVHEDDRYSHGDYSYCRNCFDQSFFYCSGCNQSFTYDDEGMDNNGESTARCNDCQSSRNENLFREYDKSNKYVSRGERPFSTEVECYAPSSEALKNVYNNTAKEIGIVTDGSLNGNGIGREFVTPKLSGKKGRKVLRKLCLELNDNRFTVDKSCGLHIHLDTKDITGKIDKIKSLFLFYLAFEPVIFSYLPMSRRKNRYCLPLTEFYHEREITACHNLEMIDKLWYREQSIERIEQRKKERYDNTRYSGINLHSLLSNGHIEIRYHSGTLVYNKIIKWIELHIAILNYISKTNSNSIAQDIQDVKFLVSLEDKQQKLFNLLQLPNNLQTYFKDRKSKFAIKKQPKTQVNGEQNSLVSLQGITLNNFTRESNLTYITNEESNIN